MWVLVSFPQLFKEIEFRQLCYAYCFVQNNILYLNSLTYLSDKILVMNDSHQSWGDNNKFATLENVYLSF